MTTVARCEISGQDITLSCQADPRDNRVLRSAARSHFIVELEPLHWKGIAESKMRSGFLLTKES